MKLVTFLVIAAAGGVYFYTQTRAATVPPKYVLAQVTRSSVIVSVNGTGQIMGRTQLELKPEVSGELQSVFVKPGQVVKTGDPLYVINDTVARRAVRDAARSVEDARISLQSSELSLAKTKKSPDTLALLTAQNQFDQANRDLAKLYEGADPLDIRQAESDLATQKANVAISSDGRTPVSVRNVYDNTVPVLRTTALAFQQALFDADAIIGVDNTVPNDAYESLLSVLDSSKLQTAKSNYLVAKAAVVVLKTRVDTLSIQNADPEVIESELREAEHTGEAVNAYLQNVADVLMNTVTSPALSQSSLTSMQNTIQSARSTVSSKTTGLLTQIQSIASVKTSFGTAQANVQKAEIALERLKQPADAKEIATAQDKVKQAEENLAKVKAGADALDVSIAENSVAARRSAFEAAHNKFADALEELAKYTVHAPFDGVVGGTVPHVGIGVTGATVLGTIVTDDKSTQITVNEVDAAKIKPGQKVTMTFDSIPDVTLTGSVYAVDPVGTVSQGVVNYTVTLVFDAQDERLKPGMSVSAAVVTEAKIDVLTVPNGAVRQTNGAPTVSVVEVVPTGQDVSTGVTLTTAPPTKTIQTGLANDQVTEVTDGLREGDMVVVRVVQATTAPTTSAASSVRLPGVGGAMGGTGAFRGAGGR